MSVARFHSGLLAAALVATALGAAPLRAPAAPTAAQVGASQDRVERAVARVAAAQQRQNRLKKQLESASTRLDVIVAEQERARARLTGRARAMYRSGDVTFVSVLLSAATFEQFASRWQLLTRMNAADAEALRRLEVSRVQARKVTQRLLVLQEDSARAISASQRERERAEREFAADKAALAAYQAELDAREAATRKRTIAVSTAAAPRASDSNQQLEGTGDWKTAVASHYGINFTGKGASGKKIGPYSMMCAHKTLPFGTLVEFEYGGERAVASVEDRGPFTAGRTFDLGPGVARVLGFEGVHEVRWRIIER